MLSAIALRAVVLAPTGAMAVQNENLRGLPAQNYINNIADICVEESTDAGPVKFYSDAEATIDTSKEGYALKS
jgi:hypothetical protein